MSTTEEKFAALTEAGRLAVEVRHTTHSRDVSALAESVAVIAAIVQQMVTEQAGAAKGTT